MLYFADDDNSYDVGIFDELKKVDGVAMFPVGLIRPVGVRWIDRQSTLKL